MNCIHVGNEGDTGGGAETPNIKSTLGMQSTSNQIINQKKKEKKRKEKKRKEKKRKESQLKRNSDRSAFPCGLGTRRGNNANRRISTSKRHGYNLEISTIKEIILL